MGRSPLAGHKTSFLQVGHMTAPASLLQRIRAWLVPDKALANRQPATYRDGLWVVRARELEARRIPRLPVLEVLYELEMPLLFVTRWHGEPALMYCCGWTDDFLVQRWLCVPLGQAQLQALKDNRLALRDALSLSPPVLLDCATDRTCLHAWQLRHLDEVPEGHKPLGGVLLRGYA